MVYFDWTTRLDIDVVVVRGSVRSFSLNLRALIGDAWHPVVRYDTHHGTLHVHRSWRPFGRQIEELDDRLWPTYDFALQAAEEDLRRRWRTYRQRMEASLR